MVCLSQTFRLMDLKQSGLLGILSSNILREISPLMYHSNINESMCASILPRLSTNTWYCDSISLRMHGTLWWLWKVFFVFIKCNSIVWRMTWKRNWVMWDVSSLCMVSTVLNTLARKFKIFRISEHLWYTSVRDNPSFHGKTAFPSSLFRVSRRPFGTQSTKGIHYQQ